LMSGVMFLFSNSEVFAQVPQTKRSDQDSFLKNIRAKKRNNDLQKARRVKGRSNQKNGNKIRFRFISGETNKDKLKGKVGKEYNKINSLNIFYNSIGIGFTSYKNEGCKGNADSGEYTYCENTLTEKPYQIGEVNVISILYNFGNNLFFTVGGDWESDSVLFRRRKGGIRGVSHRIVDEEGEERVVLRVANERGFRRRREESNTPSTATIRARGVCNERSIERSKHAVELHRAFNASAGSGHLLRRSFRFGL